MALKATDIQSNSIVPEQQTAVRWLDLPRNNPCAQCGEPIALPSWFENEERRASYLWHCRLCDYRFETIAFFAEPVNQDALAA